VTYQQPYTQPAPVRTNGLAIASMVLGITGVSILAVILGHVAHSQIKRTGDDGKGMATAGLVLGYIGTILYLVMIIALVTAVDATVTDFQNGIPPYCDLTNPPPTGC
jgi:peptidoglycan biosynthesis protein MviN/MurJ (putative lipid II flippase)